MRFVPPLLAGLLLAAALLPVRAEPIVPRSDAEVVERLPGASGERATERRLRRELAARPDDVPLAVAVARRHLAQARALGDPRHAGLAMAALQRWPDPATAPDEVLLLQATLAQYQHEFDGATARLERLLARTPRQPQAWLTLATLRRVQGRYEASDAACAEVASAGATLHALACRAENDALRGRYDAARTALNRLLATPRLEAETRGWLLTTLAELEDRAGARAAADAAWRAALAADASPYAVLGRADHLIDSGRHAEALMLLADQPSGDGVLLRRAIAGRRGGAVTAAADAREVRERYAQAALRAQAQARHAREQAMFALWIDNDPRRACTFARENVRHQREPLDLLVLAQCARADGDAAARRQVAALVAELGLVDRRIEALL
jgi:tetratricopeptide (TPR) repeat protein